jgi:hypothetical protein
MCSGAVTNSTMRYSEFAAAIGLMPERGRKPWHRQQITDIRNVVAAVEHQAGDDPDCEPLEFHRIVNEEGGPGPGFYKRSRIVTS